jgi:hypothetical protein
MARILVSTDGGLFVYAQPGSDPVVELEGRRIGAVAAHGSARWAIVDGGSVWHDDGAGWSEHATLPDLEATCLAWTDSLFVGTSQAHLLRADVGALERVVAFDEVEGRDGWYTPWGGPPDTRSIAEWDDDVYVNVHVGGIVRTSDAGASWTPTIDIDADVHQVVTADGLVLAACAGGLAMSTDRGASWSIRAEGLERTYARAVAVCGGSVLMSASSGPRGGHATVYRAPLGAGAFERCDEGLPDWFEGNIDTHWLDAIPDGSAAAFGTVDGRLFTSSDEGASWREAGTVPAGISHLLVV